MGTLFLINNEKYEGQFFNDLIDGKGIYHYENGDKYDGSFLNWEKNGFGIMNFSNGD